jgi:3-phenylpropionate/trans-cinnamate dioxygenase ferredoxin reductase subunit
MSSFDYLIIGAGITAESAMRALREADPASTIGVFGAEPHSPYDRPPLSKALWKGTSENDIWRDVGSIGARLHLGRRVESIDPGSASVVDDRGIAHGYGKLLIATGGSPRRLRGSGDRILYYRTLDDYHRLRDLASERLRFAVVGGGFIGMEIAAALRMQGREVEMFVGEDGLGTRLFPDDLSSFLVDYYREQGVVVRTLGRVEVELRDRGIVVLTRSGASFRADVAVVGVGLSPNVELAQGAGLTVGDGIEVDAFLRTSAPDVYAAGDVASFHQPLLGARIRVEHESNADAMGHAAGFSMAGQPSPYDQLPFFYSDLFDLGFEAVGELDPRMETFADWKEPFREGVIYYLAKDRVRGALLWNTWDQADNARRLIEEARPVSRNELEGRLPKEEAA